jgi:prepilin-type N-terminal cleavage/methylation domain-containing protein
MKRARTTRRKKTTLRTGTDRNAAGQGSEKVDDSMKEPSGGGKDRGFTLVEILTVIGIMALLFSAIIVVTAGAPDRARRAGTQGLLNQLSMALQRYYSEFRRFPPDGYDTPVTAPNGQQLKGSACLLYYLAWMYPDGSGGFESVVMKRLDLTDPENPVMVPLKNEDPFWSEDVKPGDLLNQYGEILDKWKNPLRYDNCERPTKDGQPLYTPDVQTMAGGSDPDPRQELNRGRPFNPDGYDLWSCGANGNTDESDAKDDIISGQEEIK